jgi:hypothetical protein
MSQRRIMCKLTAIKETLIKEVGTEKTPTKRRLTQRLFMSEILTRKKAMTLNTEWAIQRSLETSNLGKGLGVRAMVSLQ